MSEIILGKLQSIEKVQQAINKLIIEIGKELDFSEESYDEYQDLMTDFIQGRYTANGLYKALERRGFLQVDEKADENMPEIE